MNCELEQRTPAFGLISGSPGTFTNDNALRQFGQTG